MDEIAVRPKVPFSVWVFLNHLVLEMGEIPGDVGRLVECVSTGRKFTPCSDGSRYDYAVSLADEYGAVRGKFPPREFKKVYEGEDSKYTDAYDTLSYWADRTRGGESVPDDVLADILKSMGLPMLYKEYVRERLYCLH